MESARRVKPRISQGEMRMKLAAATCVSPVRPIVPRLNLKPVVLSEEILSSAESFRSAATQRLSLQPFTEQSSFTSPRVVRASHDLALPSFTERESNRRRLKAKPKFVLIGRHRRPVCVNFLMDKPLSYV